MKRAAVVSVCLLVLLAGCSTTSEPGTETASEVAVSETEVNESFTADFSRSVTNCGASCKQVNFSVGLTYTGREDEILFPNMEMSVYVLDEGLTGWGDPERKVIWSDTEFVDNMSANETVTFERSFRVGMSDGIDIIYGGDCVVYGEVAVDNSGQEWNKAERFKIESEYC